MIAIVCTALASLVFSSASYGISGFFSKAFDKSLSVGEQYEKNITVRKYYNLTVRFQKEGSSSYLSFDDNDTRIELKAQNGSVIQNVTGVVNGKQYIFANKDEVYAISTASAFSASSYDNVVDQSVNVTFSGTTAYVTIKVMNRVAIMEGYMIDDLTGEYVDGVEVLAFADGSDPQIAKPLLQNTSIGGRYKLAVALNATIAFDIYVKDYDVA